MTTDERPERAAEPVPVPATAEPDSWAGMRAISDEAMRRADEIYAAELRGEGPEPWRI
jgi:hypothetical protein